MTKKSWLVLFLLITISFNAQSNDTLSLNFKIYFDQLPLKLNQKYISAKNDTVTLSTFKCYISNIEIQYSDTTVFKQINSHHLIDVENPNTLQIPITKKSEKLISKLIFNIGIDSLTNTSGAMAGDLDPINGMYWAWQSGYINMKIEGTSPSCPTRKNEFQFHVGGYLEPYYTMRKKVINVNNQRDVTIAIDVAVFLSEINLKHTNTVMLPGKVAMDLADSCTKMFYIE